MSKEKRPVYAPPEHITMAQLRHLKTLRKLNSDPIQFVISFPHLGKDVLEALTLETIERLLKQVLERGNEKIIFVPYKRKR